MTDQTLNDVFRPKPVKQRTPSEGGLDFGRRNAKPRTTVLGYTLRRTRQMVISWLVFSALSLGLAVAGEDYARDRYGIDVRAELAMLDEAQGGKFGLAELLGVDPADLPARAGVARASAEPAARELHIMPGGVTDVKREIVASGAQRVTPEPASSN